MDIHSCMLNRRLAYSNNLKVSIHVMLLLSLSILWQEGSFLVYADNLQSLLVGYTHHSIASQGLSMMKISCS